jgi:arginine decarboxylase
MAAKIFCNISFFQSIPDAWAIGQIFPVAPISHLDQTPSMHSILQDLTCDSDGTLKLYPGNSSVNSTLLLPPYEATNPYYLGFFLVGAYQEILGNLHNLFGDTNSLDVKLLPDGQFELNDLVNGDTVTNVLHFAHFDTKKLILSYEKQLINRELPKEQILSYLNELRSIFSQLTYLDGTTPQ